MSETPKRRNALTTMLGGAFGTSFGCLAGIAVFGVVCLIGMIALCAGIATVSDDVEDAKTEPVAENKEPEVQGTADAELQDSRHELIQSLVKRRIFQKIDTPGTDPRVYVLPAFALLTFDEKQTFVSVAYAYVYRLPKDATGFNKPMWVYDGLTNKRTGSFRGTTGLRLD